MFNKGYMYYIEIAVVVLATIYVVKNFVPSVAGQVGI